MAQRRCSLPNVVTVPPAADPELAKKALRARVLASRRGLDAADLAAVASELATVMLAVPELSSSADRSARRVAAYVSVGREPGTGPLLDGLLERGFEVILPLLLPDLDLDWARYAGAHALRPALRGVLEPTTRPLGADAIAAAAVILVPALAVDRRGLRLGRGGGSYDRALARAQPGALTCALLHRGELLDLPIPRQWHDMSVRAAATPDKFLRFAATS